MEDTMDSHPYLFVPKSPILLSCLRLLHGLQSILELKALDADTVENTGVYGVCSNVPGIPAAQVEPMCTQGGLYVSDKAVF